MEGKFFVQQALPLARHGGLLHQLKGYGRNLLDSLY